MTDNIQKKLVSEKISREERERRDGPESPDAHTARARIRGYKTVTVDRPPLAREPCTVPYPTEARYKYLYICRVIHTHAAHGTHS